MSLKTVAVKTTVAEAPASAPAIPDFDVKKIDIAAYNAAVAAKKEAESTIAKLRPQIMLAGLKNLFDTNLENPKHPVSSVRLRDEEKAVVRVTFQDRYSAPNLAEAEEFFASLKLDINDFLQQSVAASFNSGIFVVNGEFNKKVFDSYRIVIGQTTKELIACGLLAKNTASPLDTVPVVQVRDEFHAKRWEAVPTVSGQTALSAVCPNTVMLTPVVELAEKK